MSYEPIVLNRLNIRYMMKASATDFFSSITNACSFLQKDNTTLKERVYKKMQHQNDLDIEANEITKSFLDIIGHELDDVRIFLINEEKEYIILGGCYPSKCKHRIAIIQMNEHTFFNVEISEENKDYLEKKLRIRGKYNIPRNSKICACMGMLFMTSTFAYLFYNFKLSE